MPHLVIEYTNNLPVKAMKQVLAKASDALIQCGLFSPIDVQARLIPLANYRIGDGTEPKSHAFVSAEVKLLGGRDQSTKNLLGEMLIAALSDAVKLEVALNSGLTIQVSALITEMPVALYFKEVIN